jgi:tetratricopeptide (TPR) repeat protein
VGRLREAVDERHSAPSGLCAGTFEDTGTSNEPIANGGYYLAVRNCQRAAEQYSELVKEYPADSAGYANLALAHFYCREMPQAQEIGRRAIEISPRNLAHRNNLAL